MAVQLRGVARPVVVAPVLATGSTTATAAGTVIASLSASPDRFLLGIAYVATAGGSNTRIRVVLTFTDDTTETLEGAATGAAPVYVGSRSGFFNNTAPEMVLAGSANAAKKVKKVEVQVGGAASAGTKSATISAHEVTA